MIEYLKMVPLPSWWQKLDLNEFPISELFEGLLSWNLESKLITPKYITSTYFGVTYMDMDMDMDMDVDMDMDMDIDVYHRPKLELACNVGSRLYISL